MARCVAPNNRACSIECPEGGCFAYFDERTQTCVAKCASQLAALRPLERERDPTDEIGISVANVRAIEVGRFLRYHLSRSVVRLLVRVPDLRVSFETPPGTRIADLQGILIRSMLSNRA